MSDLGEQLRQAAADPPPSRIDVDMLIDAGNHAATRHRWARTGTALAGVVALTVVAAIGAASLAGSPGGGPIAAGDLPTAGPSKPNPGSPAERLGSCTATGPTASATPVNGTQPVATPSRPLTEPPDQAVIRLSRTIDEALRNSMPGFSFADPYHPDCEQLQVTFFGLSATFPYAAQVVAKDSAGFGSVTVELYPAPEQRPSCDQAQCSYEWSQELPDGSFAYGFTGAPQVNVLRPDGTGVMVLTSRSEWAGGPQTRPEPPATKDQMIAIGTYPGLTLYP